MLDQKDVHGFARKASPSRKVPTVIVLALRKTDERRLLDQRRDAEAMA